jgi:hypothetical protein
LLAFHVGKGDEESCRAFWQKIPKIFQDKAIFMEGYQRIIPKT